MSVVGSTVLRIGELCGGKTRLQAWLESTADGRVYLKCEEECLAACAGAPMMVINGHYHERLTKEKVDQLLDGLAVTSWDILTYPRDRLARHLSRTK